MKGDKSSQHKSSGYQTITGRRYGRRFAYVNFRPTSTDQARPVSQQCEEYQGPGQEDDQNERATTSIALDQEHLILSDSFIEVAESEIPISQVTEESSLMPSVVQSREISGINSYVEISSEDSLEDFSPLKDPVVISSEDTDSFESDSSEDESNQVFLSSVKENPREFQEISFKLGNEGTSFCSVQTNYYGVPPQSSGLNQDFEAVGPVPLGKYSDSEKDFGPQNIQGPTSKVEADAKKFLASRSYEMQRMVVEEISVSPESINSELNASGGNNEVGASSEFVVRPKIRNREYLNRLDQNDALSSDEEEGYSAKRWRGNPEPQPSTSGVSLGSSAGKQAPRMFFGQGNKAGERKETAPAQINAEHEILQEEQPVGDGATAWKCFEADPKSNTNVENSPECVDPSSSECVDPAGSRMELPSLYADENLESSSDESFETLSVRRQPETELLLSSDSEESPEFPIQEELQISLEEADLTLVHICEAAPSNIEDESDPSVIGEFGGDDDIEDDISFGDDFDLEWRLLDEYESRYGTIPTFFPEDPDILSYVTMEDRLNQAMEAAVAHLEYLITEGEQICPPASTESIDMLPDIIVTADQLAMDLTCTICCQEFVENDVITKLPCNHYFHKLCIAAWLQKSATCPVCRYVFAFQAFGRVAAATTSFAANDEAPGSASEATTSRPTTSRPTTSRPTTSRPTTSRPTTSRPTTSRPTTSRPTTSFAMAPGATAPGATAPDATAPGATAPSTTAPGATAPGATAPGATASGATGSKSPGSNATGNQ
ncbi:E3 ubiquitin-protein ligase Praja-2 [Ornithorhynchus anatinus]|uniref:E3 ubiquitin-protein ligase RNF181 n=1 Tax=Ornithorhynchus anatinus TaxID=9258 RepID=F6SAX5_ORNAN|nr:E3 ubiquitin-protein ligase Praja-2 [Ornithorhynchus anatinus]XP_028909955.1 E3 ubiquitin-protein ligase Praja-2 [Ornithorhynchus anatinus]XP_028909956.1 E3 ubiquitin-protein ligase Praja-2 [Ornithorhynchus anatinus]XP_028909957.1 E3 ubiquitin-protein ligase Praja-2 [Ornithorhynchus anatinus]